MVIEMRDGHDTELSRDEVRAVADALQILVVEKRDFLILHADEARNYYVQFPSGYGVSTEVYCEAVADQWLDALHQIGARGASELRALGWEKPTKRIQNWHRNFEFDVDDAVTRIEIAKDVLDTLRRVYGLGERGLRVELAE